MRQAAPSPLTPEFCALPEMPENPEGVILDNRHPMRLTYGEKVPLRTSPDGDEATTSVVEFYCGVQPRPKRDGGRSAQSSEYCGGGGAQGMKSTLERGLTSSASR